MQEKATINKKIRTELSFLDGCSVYLKAIVAILCAQVLASLIIKIVETIAPGMDNNAKNILNLCVMALFQATNALVFYYFVIRKGKKLSFNSLEKGATPSVFSIITAVIIAAVCILAFTPLAQAFSLLLYNFGYTSSSSVPLGTVAEKIIGGFLLIVAAPIFEELIFRGALLSGLRQKLGIVASITLSGLAFSLMHINPNQTIFQFFLGAAAAFAVIMSGNVLSGIIVHSASNAIALIIEITPLGKAYAFYINALSGNVATLIISGVALAVCGIALIYFLGLLSNRFKTTKKYGYNLKEIKAVEKVESVEKTEDKVVVTVAKKEVQPSLSFQDSLDANGGLLGKSTGVVCYITSATICLVMWITTLVSGFFM